MNLKQIFSKLAEKAGRTNVSNQKVQNKYIGLEKLDSVTLRVSLDQELKSGTFFECEISEIPHKDTDYFAPEIAYLFRDYKVIRWCFGEIDRSQWSVYDFDPTYFVIGTGLENHFLIRRQEENIYVLPDDRLPYPEMETFPTIYHFLLNEVLE